MIERITIFLLFSLNILLFGIIIYLSDQANLIDKRILNVAGDGYYAGCGSATGAMDYCKALSLHYREEIKRVGSFQE